MATLVYLAMRLLWSGQKRELKHLRDRYEDDDEDYTNDRFSDYFFHNDGGECDEEHEDENEKNHEKKPFHENDTEKDDQSDGDDSTHDIEKYAENGHHDDEENEDKYPHKNNPENDSPDGGDTKESPQKCAEKGTQIDDDGLEITVSIRLKGKGFIPAEQTHRGRVVLRLADENIQTSTCSATVMGNEIASMETMVEGMETFSEGRRESLD